MSGARHAQGLVVAAHRRHFTVHVDGGSEARCVIRGRSLSPACGDRVDLSLAAGDDGVILRVAPRTSVIFRSDAHREKVVAANVSQVLAVVAADPPYDNELVQRWIVAAEASRCRFILAANKSDLPQFARIEPRLALVEALGYRVVRLAASRNTSPLEPALRGERSVLIGQSGMGKSTIVNAIAPGANARVGDVSIALHAGRHTTSETHLYPIDGASWIVDSPGMRAFGLAHLDRASIEHAFVEVRPYLGHCRFRDCRHAQEPGCAVRDAVAAGLVAPWRFELMKTLVNEADANALNARG